MGRGKARYSPARRDGVQGGGTRRQNTKITGETLFGPTEEGVQLTLPSFGREAHKGTNRKRRNEAGQGVGGGHSTGEPRDNRGEGRAATSTTRPKQGKAAGLPPQGKVQPRSKSASRRMESARKLQRTLYRAAKAQPTRRFTLLYDKVCRRDVLEEAWKRVKANGGAAGVDKIDVESVKEYGEELFLDELQRELQTETYRVSHVRRVHIPKPGQPGRTRPLGIPTLKDRTIQMAAKLVIEPLFEADFLPCSFGFRPKKTARMALSAILESINEGYHQVVDVDLKSYFDTIDHLLLMGLVERRVGDRRILSLIRAWLSAGVLEEGTVTHPVKGSPQGGVISPFLSNIFLHEVDRQWCDITGEPTGPARLVRYADDMVLLTRTEGEAQRVWERLQAQFTDLRLVVNQEKSRLTTTRMGFAFLGFEFRQPRKLVYMFPRQKAQVHLGERVRETVRSIPSNASLNEVIRKLNPVIVGWCTYFRVGNSNRVFHVMDWKIRTELHVWLRRKYQLRSRSTAAKRWNSRFLHERCRLYRLVGKVSHLEGLRRTLPVEGGRRAGCGKTARPVR